MTHVTLEQGVDLVLDYFCFPQQTLFHRQPSHPTLPASYIVGLCVLERSCARDEIVRISADIMALRLHYTIQTSAVAHIGSRLCLPPSENPLIASLLGFSAMYCKVASNCPSLIIRWTTIRALKTIVHVESRSRSCRVRNISATPASPVWVATRICSIYLDLGAASC